MVSDKVCFPKVNQAAVKQLIEDIPHSISTTMNNRLLLPLLLPNAQSIGSLVSPCKMI